MRSSLKLAPCPRQRIPYIPNSLGFQQKAGYPQHFTTTRACPGYSARPNCPRELYPLCSNFKSDGGSLKRQVPRNLRSRTFEGGLRPGYPSQTSARIPQRRELAATWTLNKDTRIMSSLSYVHTERRHIPLTIYRNLACYSFDHLFNTIFQ